MKSEANTSPKKFVIQSNISLTPPKRKAKIIKIENLPKRARTDENFEITNVGVSQQQEEIEALSSIIEVPEQTIEVQQAAEQVAEPSQNKLLALFDVTVEQYKKLREALDLGQNIVSVMSTIDNAVERVDDETAADDCKLGELFCIIDLFNQLLIQ